MEKSRVPKSDRTIINTESSLTVNLDEKEIKKSLSTEPLLFCCPSRFFAANIVLKIKAFTDVSFASMVFKAQSVSETRL